MQEKISVLINVSAHHHRLLRVEWILESIGGVCMFVFCNSARMYRVVCCVLALENSMCEANVNDST